MRVLTSGELPWRISLGQALASIAVGSAPLAIVARAAQGVGTPAMAGALALFGVAGVIWAEVVFWGLVGPIARALARRGEPIRRVIAPIDERITWLDDGPAS